jgi:hypothetical protein
MKRNPTIWIFLVGLIGFFLATRPASAEEITYDEVDYAALKFAGQSEQPQASDQILLIYRQVLTFDENSYGASYNEDMLAASVVAGAAVLAMDEESGSDGLRFWVDTGCLSALWLLQYQPGSPKNNALNEFDPTLGRGLDKLFECVQEALWAWFLCMFPGIPGGGLTDMMGASFSLSAPIIGASLGRYIGWKIAGWIAGLIAKGMLIWTYLCITIGIVYGLRCYYFGFVAVRLLRHRRLCNRRPSV